LQGVALALGSAGQQDEAIEAAIPAQIVATSG